MQTCGYKRKLGNVHRALGIRCSVVWVIASRNLDSNSQAVSLLGLCFSVFFSVRLVADVLGGE